MRLILRRRLVGDRGRPEVLDLKEFERQKRELEEQSKLRSKKIKACQSALCSATSIFITWFFIMIIPLGIFLASWRVGFFQFNDRFGSGFVLALLCGFLVLSGSRFITGLSISKKLSVDKKSYSKEMPIEATSTIKEFYIVQHCRRCSHYWITFATCGLCIIMIVYTLIRVGIDKLANAGTYTLKLLDSNAYSSIDITNPQETIKIFFQDWSQRVFFGSICVFLFSCLLFTIVDAKNKKIIGYLEDIYGREKLANDCLLNFKLNEVNRKYKSIAFAVVCLVGCLIYFFFKKMIITVFDKSFSV